MIDIRNADKYYNRQKSNELHVLNDISLTLPDTGMVAVFGKSGCGKTTLLNVIGGLDRADGGQIKIYGKDISDNTDDIRNEYIGYVFQNYYLSNNETVFENVANALYLCGMTDANEIRSRVCASLESVGMIHFKDRFPDTLSGGQQQRVAIARAIVKNPQVILADEPTGNLDEANTLMIMNILKQISREHLVLLVTHEADLVDLYCDRVIEIVDGKINSIRDNENANGHTSRSKNDIYLGEFEKHEVTSPGVKIEYYGEPSQQITLRVVNNGGKFYLECKQPGVKIIDGGSEIKFREGVFKESCGSDNAPVISIPPLKKNRNAKRGKLFSFKSAIVSGYRENFSGKNKKGRKLLRYSMFLFAFVVVFLTANFAVSLKTLSDIKNDHGNTVYFLPLTADTDISAISDSIGINGIDLIRVVGQSYLYSKEYISFRPGTFITASISSVPASGYVLDSKLLEGMTVASGSTDFEKPLDTVITTALADELIENSTVSFISEYSDLLNLVSYSHYGTENYMRIIGVVESKEKNFYLNSLYSTQMILENVYYNSLPVIAASLDSSHSAEIKKGETAIIGSTSHNVGDTVTIMGKKYTVTKIIKTYPYISDYSQYINDQYGTSLLSSVEYYEKKLEAKPEADRMQSNFEWFFDYMTEHFRDFCSCCANNDDDLHAWIYMKTGNIWDLINTCVKNGIAGNLSAEQLYTAYCYHLQFSEYPTEKEYEEYTAENDNIFITQYYDKLNADENAYWSAYDYYLSSRYYKTVSFVMNDEDYISLSYAVGTNDTEVCEYNLFGSDNFNNFTWYNHYMLIHTNDLKAADSYLKAQYGDSLITPDDILSEELSSSYVSIVSGIVSLAITLALIALCIFFIMRSSLMSRIKEIGIYRAIGVSKKNLTFRFTIESLVLVTLSLLPGFIIASVFAMKIASYSAFSDTLFFTGWIAILLLLFLYALALIFGTLPVRIMLKKTPSEILSKYDI